MAIDTLFTKSEQIDILWSVRRKQQEYEEQGVSKNRRFYFRQLAEKYALTERLKQQVQNYKTGSVKPEELTTNTEIAELFAVRISAVESYLSTKTRQSDKAERGRLCLQKGREQGWEYLKNSGQLHTLTATDLAKPKKYHGRKKRDNKSLENS